MSKLIPRKTGLDRAEWTIRKINEFLPRGGYIRCPKNPARSRMLRWVLRHKDLETMTRRGQHPRVVAAYDCDHVIGRDWEKENRLSHDGSLVTAFYAQVLVPILGKDLGLTYTDRCGDLVTYVATVEEVTDLATEIRRVWPVQSSLQSP